MSLYLEPGAQQAVYGIVPFIRKDNRSEATNVSCTKPWQAILANLAKLERCQYSIKVGKKKSP